MGENYYLLDHPNPNGNHYYTVRSRPLIAQVMHITASLEDLDLIGPDQSAEATARYASTTDRDVSWHSGSDTDTFLYLLPRTYTAWQCVDYNSSTAGHEISKTDTNWKDEDPRVVEVLLRNAADCLRPHLLAEGIPLRKATKDEVDRARATNGPAVGLISHHELDPDRRTDPGWAWINGHLEDTFPWEQFINMLKNPTNEEDWMANEDVIALLTEIRDQTKATKDIVTTILTQGFRATDKDGNVAKTVLNNSIRGVNGQLIQVNENLTKLVELASPTPDPTPEPTV